MHSDAGAAAPAQTESEATPPADDEYPTPSRSRLRAIDWRPILLEAFFVVLGVALALAANEWRQWLVDRRRAGVALESIRQELASNRQAVLDAVQYHTALLDTLVALRRQARADADAPPPSIGIFARGFVSPASVLSTAWATASETDALRHMTHDDVLVLARIYEQQRRYTAQTDQVGGLIYAQMFDRGMDGMVRNYVNLSSIISSFWYVECGLLSGYDRALAELGADTTGRAPAPPRCQRVSRR